jgi:hypothetical protein
MLQTSILVSQWVQIVLLAAIVYLFVRVLGLLVLAQKKSTRDRRILPMSSGVNVLPNTSISVTTRPQDCAFRPERILIGGNPGDWIVNDIKIRNRSQFVQSGDVPGEMFASTSMHAWVVMDAVPMAADFVLLVTYIGEAKEGAPFVCSVLGEVIDEAEKKRLEKKKKKSPERSALA